MIPPGCLLLLECAAVHDASSGPTEADWIRWFGVAIAVAGVLIAAPDGAAWAWHQAVAAGRWVRGRLALYLPFVLRDLGGQARVMADFGGAVETMAVEKRIEWNVAATDW